MLPSTIRETLISLGVVRSDDTANGHTRTGDQQRLFTLAEVSEHCEPHDCWIVVADYVYDVTLFLRQHPGGADIMLEQAGRDATVAYRGAGHGAYAAQLLSQSCIGRLVKSDRMNLYSLSTESISESLSEKNSSNQFLWHSKKQVMVVE